jgi:oligopeptide/dipeptide ABC transporter ATP-binding protein
MVITLILALVGWPGSARTIRGMVHSIKREEFVVNATLEGIPTCVIIFKYIIPQITSLLIVNTALSVPGFIMSETTLSYLGLGINDPAVSWGSLINRDISTLSNLKNFPWLLYPVFMLLLVTLAFNFLGGALRDFYDPYNAVFNKRKKISKIKNDEASCEKDNLLSIKNLNVTFSVLRGTKRILVYGVRDVSFAVKKGEILGIVGESGSGKSVSTTAIPGLLPSNATMSGKIFFDGTDLTALSQKELIKYRGSRIALIFQEPGRSFDPLQNIGNVFYETFRKNTPEISKEEAFAKAVELLNEVGLPDPEKRLSSYPHQFSGGQLQRIGIALAIAQDCELLIADEPTTALDVTIQAQIISLLLRLKQQRNLSIIFISHDIDLVAKISDRIAVMYGGKIMEIGNASQIINSPKHPYTQALVSALPKFGSHYTINKMISIPGKVLESTSKEIGCPFYARCSYAKDVCKEKYENCYKVTENKE